MGLHKSSYCCPTEASFVVSDNLAGMSVIPQQGADWQKQKRSTLDGKGHETLATQR